MALCAHDRGHPGGGKRPVETRNPPETIAVFSVHWPHMRFVTEQPSLCEGHIPPKSAFRESELVCPGLERHRMQAAVPKRSVLLDLGQSPVAEKRRKVQREQAMPPRGKAFCSETLSRETSEENGPTVDMMDTTADACAGLGVPVLDRSWKTGSDASAGRTFVANVYSGASDYY